MELVTPFPSHLSNHNLAQFILFQETVPIITSLVDKFRCHAHLNPALWFPPSLLHENNWLVLIVRVFPRLSPLLILQIDLFCQWHQHSPPTCSVSQKHFYASTYAVHSTWEQLLASSYKAPNSSLPWNVSFSSPGSDAYKTPKGITRFAENTVILANQHCMIAGFSPSLFPPATSPFTSYVSDCKLFLRFRLHAP